MADPGEVRLTGRLPKSDAHNGLHEAAKELLDEPTRLRYAVIAYDVQQIVDDVDASTESPTVRIRRIEPLVGGRLAQGERLLNRAAEARLGWLPTAETTEPEAEPPAGDEPEF